MSSVFPTAYVIFFQGQKQTETSRFKRENIVAVLLTVVAESGICKIYKRKVKPSFQGCFPEFNMIQIQRSF